MRLVLDEVLAALLFVQACILYVVYRYVVRHRPRGKPFDKLAAAALWPDEPAGRPEVGSMLSARGYRIATYAVRAERPIATAVLLHGYRTCARFEFLRPRKRGEEHTCWEGSTIERLVGSGVSCVLLDHMGHGCSEGLPAYLDGGVDAVVDDVVQLLAEHETLAAGLPMFLVGISMGGLVAARVAQRLGEAIVAPTRSPALAGLVCVSPLISMETVARKNGALKIALLRAAAYLAPRAVSGMHTTHLRDHPLYVIECRSEPTYYHGTARYGTLATLYDTCTAFLARGGRGSLDTLRVGSLLAIHSRTDTIADAAGSTALFERVSAAVKACVLIKGAGGTRDGELRFASEPGAPAVNGASAEALKALLPLPLHHNLPREPGGEAVAAAIGAWVRTQALSYA